MPSVKEIIKTFIVKQQFLTELISIELISKGEVHLKETLESIITQDFKDFEIVCADSSGSKDIRDLLKQYDCRVIDLPIGTFALEARYKAHANSYGEWCLLLDSTRPLKKNALITLRGGYTNYDMTIIKEDSMGTGFWVEQARKLADISTTQFNRLDTETLPFLLPRFYRKEILDLSFSHIKEMTKNVFEKISYGEHHLIFEEARKLSKNIGLTDEKLISHYEDDSLLKILRKYHWYGRSQRTLGLIESTETKSLSSHVRRKVPLRKRIETIPISAARIIPFLIGYFIV